VPPLAISWSCDPVSRTPPLPITTMRSALRTVENRCETTTVTAPERRELLSAFAAKLSNSAASLAASSPPGDFEIAQGDAVDEDLGGGWFVHSKQQLDERGFTGAIIAH
jgi:hypothetical protein